MLPLVVVQTLILTAPWGSGLGGGVLLTFVKQFNVGLDLRFSFADVNLSGVDADAGGGHFGLLLGYHF